MWQRKEIANLAELFSSSCDELTKRNILFAVAGGFAAVLYRAQDRLTADIDIAITSDGNEQVVAKEIFQTLGLSDVRTSRLADLEGGPLFAIKNKSTPLAIMAGRPKENASAQGLDFILPTVPWVPSALVRAEYHKIDWGFGRIPTLTLEDVIISKLYARKANYRPKDEDDLISIFAMKHNLDTDYLNAMMQSLLLTVPKTIRDKAPTLLVKISKDVEKRLRRNH